MRNPFGAAGGRLPFGWRWIARSLLLRRWQAVSMLAATQHYADFDAQVHAVLGPDRGGDGRFEDAARLIEQLFLDGLRPR